MANVGRSDLPGIVSAQTRWITWLTAPRVPAFANGFDRDVLLVADAGWVELAQKSGWPKDAVHAAGWPRNAVEDKASSPVALLADTRPIAPPKSLADYSSHRLLWERIESELLTDPFSLRGDVRSFLESRQQRLNISDAAFDARIFIEQLILPLYQQGLARALLLANIPVKLYGTGWDKIAEFAPHHAGSISNRQQFERSTRLASAIVYAWPMASAHPIDAVGKPVLRPSQGKIAFVNDARRAVAGLLKVETMHVTELSAELLTKFMPAGKHAR
jgi:hypothetical protein